MKLKHKPKDLTTEQMAAYEALVASMHQEHEPARDNKLVSILGGILIMALILSGEDIIRSILAALT